MCKYKVFLNAQVTWIKEYVWKCQRFGSSLLCVLGSRLNEKRGHDGLASFALRVCYKECVLIHLCF